MKRVLSYFLIMMLAMGLLSGCSSESNSNDQQEATNQTNEQVESNDKADSNNNEETNIELDESIFTKRDQDSSYDESKAVKIVLNGDFATASSDSVKVNGTNITISEEATYIISGSLNNGMIIVDSNEKAKLQLVFDGVTIENETGAALYIKEADKVFLTLASGSSNTLSNSGEFVAIDDNNIDGTIFSKQDLTINGNGSLKVSSSTAHGIVCKDDLVFTDGSYEINSASHGLDVNDSVRIASASININAGKDGIHCENEEDSEKGFIYIASGSINGEVQGDGISSSSYIQVEDGTIELLAGGGSVNSTKEHSDSFGGFMGGPGGRGQSQQNESSEDSTSMKGLKADTKLIINGGTFKINSADDAIHSNDALSISGGSFEIASGDDAIHAEETLTIAKGIINISECYEGLEALHIDVQGGDIKIVATDDGFNAAGGNDQSGYEGGRDGMFEGGRGPGGPGGMSSNSNGSIVVSGGTIYINSSGDGMDANGTLEISGGHTTVVGPTQGDTATLDFDKTGIISGGTFIGTGSTMMAQTFDDSSQGVIAVNAGNRSANTLIEVKDQSGNVIVSREPELDFAIVIISTPEIIKGETYSLTIGSDSGDIEAY